MKQDFKWGAIILAAGASSRMGHSKQLLKVEGETLIRRVVESTQEAEPAEIIVVVNQNSEAIKNELKDKPVHLVTNPEFEKGMGSSLKSGLRFLMKNFQDVNAALFLVCDQPLLTSNHLKNMVEAHVITRKPIVSSFYSGKNGVPVLFHQSMFENVLAIEDQQGAKKIIDQNPTLVKSIEFPAGAIDLDTPGDLERFVRNSL